MVTKRSNEKSVQPHVEAAQQAAGGEESPVRPEEGAKLKRTFKDSVFCDLFGERENALAAFLELHPEETGVTVNDIEIVTVKSVLVDGVFNDLGFTIGGHLIVLVEAQSTWTPRIAVRALVYFLETLKRWLDVNNIDLYRGPAFELPASEAYVLYTGNQKKVPKEVSLERDFSNGERSFLEGTVKVLRGEGEGILSEYVKFTKVGDMLREKHGYTRKAAEMTVDYCISHGILDAYLSKKRIEVVDMLEELFDQERVQRIHEESLKREMNAQVREAEEKAQAQVREAEEKAQAQVREAEEKAQARVRRQALMMLEDGEPLEKIVRYTELPVDYVEKLAREAADPS